MLKEIAYTLAANLVLALALVMAPAFSDQGVPDSDKAAQQAGQPMPETPGH